MRQRTLTNGSVGDSVAVVYQVDDTSGLPPLFVSVITETSERSLKLTQRRALRLLKLIVSQSGAGLASQPRGNIAALLANSGSAAAKTRRTFT